MTRVLFPFVGDTIGGSHHSAVLLMDALPAQGITPVPLIHGDGPLLAFLRGRGFDMAKPAGLPFWHAGGRPLAGLLRLARVTPALARHLRGLRVDAVHVNDGRMAISWSLACRLAGVPMVVHQRTRYAPSRLLHLALRQARHIACISAYVHHSLPPGLAANASIIANPFAPPCPVEPEARTRLRAALGISENDLAVGFVGSLTEQKRPLLFVEAAARLPATCRFFLFGRAEGAVAGRVRARIAELGLAERVTVTGFRPDMEQCLAACDLVLAPAVNEGFGRVLVEAALAGVPVVAARSGGHGEAVAEGQTALLVPPDDADALAAAAAALIGDPIRRATLAVTARHWAHDRFSVHAHASAIASLYAEGTP